MAAKEDVSLSESISAKAESAKDKIPIAIAILSNAFALMSL